MFTLVLQSCGQHTELGKIEEEKYDCNLLKLYSKQHKYIKFLECGDGTGQIIKYAKYEVKGSHSWEIENYLIENYDMGNLKFLCCGWEPQDGKKGKIEHKELKKLNKDYHLTISMFGNAEKMNEYDSLYIEKDRSKIDFIVTVELLKI